MKFCVAYVFWGTVQTRATTNTMSAIYQGFFPKLKRVLKKQNLGSKYQKKRSSNFDFHPINYMDYKLSKKICLLLLAAQTSDEVEKIVHTEDFFKHCKWVPYGDRANNVGTIDGQMHDADNALMEKITNSVDAILMRRCYEENIDPRDRDTAPGTMAEAIDRFFGGKEKLREKRSDFAKEWLRITAEGGKERPTITVIDKGEGQQPNDLRVTILSLNKEIKGKIRFVYGTYNQGGASPLGFAGKAASYEENYLQLVISRRAQTIVNKADNRSDHFGFTLVRKRFDKDAEKYTYEYFVEDGTDNIFSFPFEKAIATKDENEFTEGCLIRLYDYQLPQRGNIVFRGLNEFIEKKLPDAPLPIYLKELRDYKGGIDYTIFGLKERLSKRIEILREGYPQVIPVDLGEIGKKNVEIFILDHKVNVEKKKESIGSYLEQKSKIYFVKDGLVLHTESASWLRNECNLQDLCNYIFAFIDISNISPAIAQILHSGREKFKNNVTTKEMLDRLRVFMQNENFKELDAEYGRLTVNSETQMVDENLREQVMKDIEQDPEIRDFFDLGEDMPIKKEQGEKKKEKYKGTYVPEKFELIGDDPKVVPQASYCRVTFDTGADDRLFERRDDKGKYDWSKSEKFDVAFHSYKNGKLTFRVDAARNANIDDKDAIIFSLKVPSRDIEFSKPVTFVVTEEEKFEGKEFPTFFESAKEKFTIPKEKMRKIVILTDVLDDYFVREKLPGSLKVSSHSELEFEGSNLKDGKLSIRMRHTGKDVKECDPLKISITDEQGSNFSLEIPVEITNEDVQPELKLPIPECITKDQWNNATPPWDEHAVARIPGWNNLTKIQINVDAVCFDELKRMSLPDKELARKVLIKQIYMHSLWLFFALKDLSFDQKEDSSEYSDPRDQIFENAIRAAAKGILPNMKKLSR